MKHTETEQPKPSKGQALVEAAVIVPILAFMLVGMVEVGWALRGYLSLANINREVTRRAVKVNILDFSERTGVWEDDTASTGYWTRVIDPYINFDPANPNDFADNFQLPNLVFDGFNDDEPNDAYLSMTYFVVNTGLPCADMTNCDCDQFDTAYDSASADPAVSRSTYYGLSDNFIYDDIILHPGPEMNFDYFFYTHPLSGTVDLPSLMNSQSRILNEYGSYENFAYLKALENSVFNCDLLSRNPSLDPSNNNIMYGELYFRQPQLLGFPIYSVAGGVPMYTQTSFRLMPSLRNRVDPKTVGPICAPLPFLADETVLSDALDRAELNDNYDSATGDVIDPFAEIPINLLANNPIEVLDWGTGSSSEQVTYRFTYPQSALSERVSQGQSELRVGESSISVGGTGGLSNAELEGLINDYAGQEVLVPLNTSFSGVAKVIISSVDLANNEVEAYLAGSADSECFDTASW